MIAVRPRVLLVHGWGHSGSIFAPLVESLGERAVCRAPDLPGHGARRAEEVPSRLRRLTRDVVGWSRETWSGEQGPLLVLGWSLGALLVLDAFTQDEEPIAAQGLVLAAGTACFLERQDYPEGQKGEVLHRLRQWVSRDPDKALTRFRSWMDVELPALAIGEEPPDRRALDVTLGLLARGDVRAALSRVELPVLLLHGEKDRIVPLASSEYLAARLPHAELVRLPVGHVPFVTAAAECAAAILAFAARIGPGEQGVAAP